MSESITRLEGAIARLGADHEPPAGWQARVLAAVAEPRRRPRWWWFAVPALAAAVVVAIVLGTREPPAPQQLALAVNIAEGSAIVRGTMARVGDLVHATASGGRHRAVWIYRDDRELVIACPGAAACTSTGTTLAAEAKLAAPGRYTVIALDSAAPLPAPTGSLDADLAAAQTAGATSRIETIEVR